MMARKFELVILDEAKRFVLGLPRQAMSKVFYNVQRIADGERNTELFKKLEGTEIWEFRTLYNGIQYRLFAFWDTRRETLVVATHGIIKKSQKTPSKEIAKAEKIRQEYLNSGRK
jgi:phage-related protein